MLGINEKSRAMALTNNLRYEYQGYKLVDEKKSLFSRSWAWQAKVLTMADYCS